MLSELLDCPVACLHPDSWPFLLWAAFYFFSTHSSLYICMTSLTIGERQMKTPVRNHHTPLEWLSSERRYQGLARLECDTPSLAASYGVKHTLTQWSSNSTLGYLPRKNENTSPHKGFYVNIHSSFICNSQTPAKSWISINTCLGQLWSIHTTEYNKKITDADKLTNMGVSSQHYIEWKQLDTLRESIYI